MVHKEKYLFIVMLPQRNQKGKICFMDMGHAWYLFINGNIKEGVNFINFHIKVSLHAFC